MKLIKEENHGEGNQGFFVKLADGCKLLKDLVATGGIEPPTLGL
jgi:hypothetical protein